MTPQYAFKEAIAFFGSKTALAKKLQIRPWSVHKWNENKIPYERCLEIEDLTNGLVKADDLRPDMNWALLRSSKNNRILK